MKLFFLASENNAMNFAGTVSLTQFLTNGVLFFFFIDVIITLFAVESGRTCQQVVGDRPHSQKFCHGNEKPGAVCEFLCHKDYKMIGSKRITCSKFPRCQYRMIVPMPDSGILPGGLLTLHFINHGLRTD